MEIVQSTAYNSMIFMVDTTDHITGLTGLTLTITASKNGAAFSSISPTVTERGNGWYNLALTSSHTDTLGDLALHITGTGADPSDLKYQIVSSKLSTSAVTKLELSSGQIVTGTVDTVTNTHTPTTTELQADDITEATTDHFKDRVIIFTSGVLANQAKAITGYSQVGGIGQFTTSAFTEAPSNNDTFIIV